jgi:hypothetical protein
MSRQLELRGAASDAPWSAPDGIDWVFSPQLDTWGGWRPGGEDSWCITPAQFAERYPDYRP